MQVDLAPGFAEYLEWPLRDHSFSLGTVVDGDIAEKTQIILRARGRLFRLHRWPFV